MRMGVHKYVGRRAVLTEYLQYLLDVAALFRARVEPAVGKSTRAALAETVIGVGVDDIVAGNLRHIHTTGIDIFAALENDRTYAKLD